MATIADAERIATALPGAEAGSSYGHQAWQVAGKTFAWVRSFSKADLKRFGDDPVPEGPILAVRTADLDAKDAVLAAGEPGVFTIEHFHGYAGLLIRLEEVAPDLLEELIMDGWRAMGGRDD